MVADEKPDEKLGGGPRTEYILREFVNDSLVSFGYCFVKAYTSFNPRALVIRYNGLMTKPNKRICALKLCNNEAEFFCGNCQGVDYCS